jgi:phosphonate degradation associated HDIG domain protein
MALTLTDIRQLFDERGHEQYTGEPVTQLEHALQTALLAEQAGADEALITAALLHDLGHLLHNLGATPTERGIDDLHQYRALPFLHGLFGAEVLGAIGGHVDAKRYLCAVQPGYFEMLSDDSQRSLQLQGGIFTANQARAFMAKPGADGAVRLRIWDDLAKTAGLITPPLDHYLRIAAKLASRAVDVQRVQAPGATP